MSSPELTVGPVIVDERKTRFEDGSQSKLSDEAANESLYAEAGEPRPGFTVDDRRDMYRMGKIQELKVSLRKI